MGTRTSRIDALRGFCREFGIAIAQGSRVGVEQISRVLADPTSAVPTLIRGTMRLLDVAPVLPDTVTHSAVTVLAETCAASTY
jgi:hypothetical protein